MIFANGALSFQMDKLNLYAVMDCDGQTRYLSFFFASAASGVLP